MNMVRMMIYLFSLAIFIPAVKSAELSGSDLQKWTIFTYVDASQINDAMLKSIPSSMPGANGSQVYGKPVMSNANGMIDIAAIAGSHKQKAAAYAFSVINRQETGKFKIGTSADWWIEWKVNGKTVYSTLEVGNKILCTGITDHVFELPLERGRNLIMVKILSGQGGWKFYAGINDLVKHKKIEVQKNINEYVNNPFDYIADEEGPRKYQLPELLQTKQGSTIIDLTEWQKIRRNELLQDFNDYIYGAIPKKFDKVSFKVIGENREFMSGKATKKDIEITISNAGKNFSFPLYLYIPNQAKGPFPVFVLINHRYRPGAELNPKSEFMPVEAIIGHGYALAMFNSKELAADNPQQFRDGIMPLFPQESADPNGWKTISAWAFGAMRCIDYLQTDPQIDKTKIISIGHSRGGKASLWTAANDPRIAYVCVNDSGSTGAAISRQKLGETITDINKGFPHWFNARYKQFDGREKELPIDQHMLIALVAPRFVHVASAVEDLWSDPRAEYLSLLYAAPALKLYGLTGLPADRTPILDQLLYGDGMAYHIRRGKHDLNLQDWNLYMKGADAWFNSRK